MRTVALFALLLISSQGCSNSHSEDTERATAAGIRNALDYTLAVMGQSSNQIAGKDWRNAITSVALRDTAIRSLLNNRKGPKMIMNTNLDAWLRPDNHGQEVAIISTRVLSDRENICYIAIRFNGEFVRFSSLPGN